MPKEVIKDLKFVYVSHMDEVLNVALLKQLPKIKEHEAEAAPRPVLHATPPAYQAD